MFRAEDARARRQTPARPAPTWHREHEDENGVVVPAVLAAVAGLVAMWPYTSVIEPGAWSFTVLAVIIMVGATGALMRTWMRRRSEWLRDLTTFAVQLAVAVAVLTRLIAGDSAVLGIVPTPTTFSVFRTLAAAAWEEIAFGSAPLEATAGLAAVLGAGFALVAILLDHLVSHRSAILAILLTGVLGAVPMIVTLGDTNIVWFVLLGIFALVLLRFTARRHPLAPRRSSTSLAAGVGVAALAVTIVIAPGLPVTASLAGTGAGITVDASLRLGDDLRQPNPVEVLTVATKNDVAPYLRLTTLSQFNGRIWEPDRGDLNAQSEGFGEPEWGPDIATKDTTTSIRVLRMSSSWLPLPYPATGVQGLAGTWRVMPNNRTLVSRNADAVGNDYTVASTRVSPTLEQIRAIDAAPPVVDDGEDPVELPAVIGELAAEVTEDATTDYDRLVALQTWFRSSFTYSLETPVEEDFDGTGADAVARFLDVRSGYCVHFAGAFALMAQSLDMQARIVVGYLPGSLTDEKRGEESIFSVESDQLHSWPEVLFPGVGWIPFEPTASLGVPTAFAAAATEGTGTSGPSTPAPTASPQAQQTTGPEVDRGDAGDNSSSNGALRRLDPTPVVLTVVGALVLLLLPALVRGAERGLRLRRARRGDAGAAWAELRDTMIDLRLPVSDADTPRVRGAALVRDSGVDAAEMRALTDAVEQANYARSGAEPEDLAGPLRSVLGAMHARSDRFTRAKALLVPRSLFATRNVDAATVV
jgi:transglutaminase-like putative cysteine protease/alpha-D-ribose 1-methylphosphonate 5-triphosphate synthase subunit PhnG